MKSYEHLSYDPIDFADELAKLDVMIAEKVREAKLKIQEGEGNEEEIFALATDLYGADFRLQEPESSVDKHY